MDPEHRGRERILDIDPVGLDAEPDLVIRRIRSRPSCTNSITESATEGVCDPPECRWVIPRTSKMSAKSAPNRSWISNVTSVGL